MKNIFLDCTLILIIGIAITIFSLGTGFLTNGNYSFILASNFLLYGSAGIIKRYKFSGVNLLLFSVIVSIPYWVYYYTQFSATPKIIIFPLVNILAVFMGFFLLKRFLTIKFFSFLILSTLFSVFSGSMISNWVSSKNVNYPASDFKVESLDGTIIDSRQLKGKILIVDFWATWCAPCIAEFKQLEKFQNSVKKNKSVEILVINEDDGGNKDKVFKFLENRTFQLPFYVDEDASTYEAFKADSFPALFVIDKEYNIRMVKKGFNSADDLSSTLVELVNELD